MKTLKIDNEVNYEMTYEAIVGRIRGYNIQQARVVGKILDKFEAMGKVKEIVRDARGDVTLYTPISIPNTIELEDDQFNLIREVFQEAVWGGTSSRRAVEVDDWLTESMHG